ncbi:MAG: ABC transporter ATP-binding protein [Leucobacter sp.]
MTYGSGPTAKSVLADLNLSVRAGEFVCIVGPSGAGKTTLIRCISGLMLPTSGIALLDGSPISEPPERLALVSQDYSRSLMPWLRVEDNIKLPLRGKGIRGAEIKRRTEEALASVGLAHASRSYPSQLSGGMQQRVSIARALAYHPEVLVMDEPFASVDAQTRAELEDLILELQRRTGMTILLVTHDIDESIYLADRVVVLGGTPATIRQTIDIDLGVERDQLITKSRPEFVAYRAEVLRSIRAARLQRD